MSLQSDATDWWDCRLVLLTAQRRRSAMYRYTHAHLFRCNVQLLACTNSHRVNHIVAAQRFQARRRGEGDELKFTASIRMEKRGDLFTGLDLQELTENDLDRRKCPASGGCVGRKMPH